MTKLTNQQFQATNLANILVFASLWPQYGANTEWADPCRTKHKISYWIFLNCLNFSKWFAIQPARWERSGCNWQTVPSQWGRGRLFDGSTRFFTKTAVSRERKVEKSFPRWEMNGLSEGYKGAADQNWGRMAKIGFYGQKPRFWAQKKTHFCTLTMFWPRPEKVVQRKKLRLPK